MELGSVCKQDEFFRHHNSLNYKILPVKAWSRDFGIGVGKKDRIARELQISLTLKYCMRWELGGKDAELLNILTFH